MYMRMCIQLDVCLHMRACMRVFVHSRCGFVCGMHVCDHEGIQASMYKCLYNFYHFLDMVQQKEPITEYCIVGQLIQKYLCIVTACMHLQNHNFLFNGNLHVISIKRDHLKNNTRCEWNALGGEVCMEVIPQIFCDAG